MMDNIIMITWLVYKSSFLKVGYAAIDIEQFATMEKCQSARNIVIEELAKKANSVSFDKYTVVCKKL